MRRTRAWVLAFVSLTGCSASHTRRLDPGSDAGSDAVSLSDAYQAIDAAPPSTGRAIPMCASTGGPGWALVFSETPDACDGVRTPYVLIQLAHELESNVPRSYQVGDARADGVAWLCPLGAMFCTFLWGEVRIASFRAGDVAEIAFDLRDASGVTTSSTASIRQWCAATLPTCR